MKKSAAFLVALALSAAAFAQEEEFVVPDRFDASVFIAKQGRGRAQQGMEIYGKYIFSLEDGGHVNIYNFKKADGVPVAGFELASSRPDNHANNAEFGVEKKKGASFPLLYITNGKVGSEIEWKCFVESITKKGSQWTSEIAQTITLDGCKGWKEAGYTEIFGAPSWLIDRERKELWVFSAIQRTTPKVTKHNWENLYVATKFRIPALSEGPEVILGVDDILAQKTFPYDMGFTQAGCVRDGKIYYCYGVGKRDKTRPAGIRVYDTDSGEIAARYNMREVIDQEPEDIVIKGDWIYLNANTNAKTGETPNIYRVSMPGKFTARKSHPRDFIAHRGVHLVCTVAGENSLEAIDLAKRAGFKAIETDCRYTSDSVLVIIHDAALNRTFLNADGTKLGAEKVNVADLTFEQFRNDYKLKASREEYRVQAPTLKEYLERCKENGLYVYIEPKLHDPTGRYYLDIMEIADEVLGRGNYNICSNNFANRVIRDTLGIKEIPLMGILYQTTWEDMDNLGNTTFALNPAKFDPQTFHNLVQRTVAEGKLNETNSGLRSNKPALNLALFNIVLREGNDIDIISTDHNAPDYWGQGRTVANFKTSDPAKIAAKLSKLPVSELYGIYFDMEFEGTAAFRIGPDEYTAGPEFGGKVCYSRSVFNCVPEIEVKAGSDDFKMRKCKIRIVEF